MHLSCTEKGCQCYSPHTESAEWGHFGSDLYYLKGAFKALEEKNYRCTEVSANNQPIKLSADIILVSAEKFSIDAPLIKIRVKVFTLFTMSSLASARAVASLSHSIQTMSRWGNIYSSQADPLWSLTRTHYNG